MRETADDRDLVAKWKKIKADLMAFCDDNDIKGHRRVLLEILVLREAAVNIRKASGRPTPTSAKPGGRKKAFTR